ncbi:MAG: adenine phosphoribosyltransferase, partial [Bacteroidales bacterium]|nr:adenine phosphoribosyltransferase [Bacteroidales bacterium]
MKDLKDYIRTIPDFPIKGIQFRDITTLIQNAEGFHLAIDKMCDMVKHLDYDVIIGAESRGFVFSAPMAYNQNTSLV